LYVEERDAETFGFPIPGPVQAKFKTKGSVLPFFAIQLSALAFPSKKQRLRLVLRPVEYKIKGLEHN